jgi:NADP-dependent 3-hydroxy acid dehydrogenase YdfG
VHEQRRGGGKIINVTSIQRGHPNPGGAGYECSESALTSIDSDHVTGSTYVMDGGLVRSVGQGA